MFLGREPGNENFPSGSARILDGKNIEYSRRLVENFRFCPSENSFRFSSAILLSEIKSLFLSLDTSPQEHVTTSTTYYHGKCVLIFKFKDFR